MALESKFQNVEKDCILSFVYLMELRNAMLS